MHLDHDFFGSHTHPVQDTPMEELEALLKYMLSHNAAHTAELKQTAAELEAAGLCGAYAQVMEAAAEYEKGNQHLKAALALMKNG